MSGESPDRLLSRREATGFLTEATDLLLESADYEAGLQTLTDRIRERLGGGAAVYVIAPDGYLHLRAQAGPAGHPDTPLPELVRPDQDHPVARALREESSLFLDRSGGPVPLEAPPEDDPPVGTQLVLPLVARGRTLGALILFLGPDGRSLGEEDLFFTRELALRVALALDGARLLREAREAGQARVDFLSVMSHELRTPLTAIVGYADILEAGISGPVTDRQREQLAKIKASAWNLQGLIDGILTYARFEAEEGELEVEALSIRDVVEEALVGERANLEDRGLELQMEIEEDLPPLPTDRRKVVRILAQLLSNAVKFTPGGGVHVRAARRDGTIRIRVEDTGVGIPPEHLEAVFEPFWQAERAETRTIGGTGLGLSLARRLAGLLDGDIEVESEPGVGSAFTLVLPLEGPGPDLP